MNRAHQVFEAAVDLPPGGRREFLDAALAGEPGIRAEVESLLRSHDAASAFLDGPTGGGARGGSATPLGDGPGAVIGRYKLLQEIGEGGFGVVFLAEQREPVVRKVALKIIKWGMDTKQVIARFEAERQALAMMDHPHIAKVLDAGATETGRPYFVMELVRGDPITAYCDRNNLSTRDRLDLFTQVCHAVQHAHQKGVIHRDIKPSNVLITVADGRPIPKVIDFGIAKATSARLTEKTLFTEHRALIGTPAYMSPEQAEMSGVDIDTRSDIYSLGVLLYELLTGTTPFDTKSLMAAGLAEIQRIIREVEPEKPSTRLSTLKETLPSVASQRHTEPGRLSTLVRGDLDWIVMKALEKNRTRRYETASGLAADVMRHLGGEPVSAAPPSTVYRVRKFVRRHRVGVGAGAAIAAALVLALGIAAFGLIAARASEAQARRSAAEAERNVEAARAVNAFLNVDLLRSIVPEGENVAGRGRDVKLREVLDEAGRRLDAASAPGGRFADKPIVEASVRLTLGEALLSLGEPSAAEPHVLRGHDLWVREYGAESGPAAETTLVVARLRWAQGRHEEAATLLRAVLDRRERASEPENKITAAFRASLALTYRDLGRYAEAEALYDRVVEYYTRTRGAEDPNTLDALNGLAMVYADQRRFAEAEPLYRRVVEGSARAHGRTHPATLRYTNNLVTMCWDQARYDEAEPLMRGVLDATRKVHGPDHPDTVAAMGNLAALLRARGDPAAAEPIRREALEISGRTLGPEHPTTLLAATNLAGDLCALGRHDEAEPLLLGTLEAQRRVQSPEEDKLKSMSHLSLVYKAQERFDEAERLLVEKAELQRRLFGPEHVDTLGGQTNLASLYRAMGRLDEAREILEATLPVKRRVLGLQHPFTRICMINLAVVLEQLGRAEEAKPLRDELAAWEAAQRSEPPK